MNSMSCRFVTLIFPLNHSNFRRFSIGHIFNRNTGFNVERGSDIQLRYLPQISYLFSREELN